MRWLSVVVALACEAKPVVTYYRLKRVQESPFVIYQGHDMSLIISGVGKLAAAAATAYLAGREQHTSKTAAWLNIGISGCQDLAIGQIFLAHKVVDAQTKKTWYPGLIYATDIPGRTLISTDQVCTHYAAQTGYDMEAAGYFYSATKVGTLELIHSLKIVSDNHAQDLGAIHKTQVSDWIGGQLQAIDQFIQQMCTAHTVISPAEIEGAVDGAAALQSYMARWHFTQNEQHQLKKILQRYAALKKNPWPNAAHSADMPVNASQVLAQLTQRLEQHD